MAYENLGQGRVEYPSVDYQAPATYAPCPTSFGFKCATSEYTCYREYNKRISKLQCKRPLKECNCKESGCRDCLDVDCLKKKIGCKISKGKPGKLCSLVGMWSIC